MLKIKNLSVKNILEDISFELEGGTFTAVLGKNGSGKTTLLRAIVGEINHSGEKLCGGENIQKLSPRERAKRISYLPQHLPASNITVRSLVTLGRNPHVSLGGAYIDADICAIESAIKSAGLCGFEERRLCTLSGGEKQRAFLAMTLAEESEVLLLDEPCAFLDMPSSAEFTKLLSSLSKTVLVVMHDISLALSYADNILLLDGGKQVFFGKKADILKTDIIEKTFSLKRLSDGKNYFFLPK